MCKILKANFKKKFNLRDWTKAGGFSPTKVVSLKTADLGNVADNVGSPRLGNVDTLIPS